MRFPNQVRTEGEEQTSELDSVGRSGGVIPIVGPMPGDGVLDALLQVHILYTYLEGHKLLYVDGRGDFPFKFMHPIVVPELLLHHSVCP